jgi:hypothetical protein
LDDRFREEKILGILEANREKFDDADRRTKEALACFRVPSASRLHYGHLMQEILTALRNFVLDYFRDPISPHRLTGGVQGMITFLDRIGIDWDAGRPEGEWSRYVIKEIWWPLLVDLSGVEQEAIEKEVVILDRVRDVLS